MQKADKYASVKEEITALYHENKGRYADGLSRNADTTDIQSFQCVGKALVDSAQHFGSGNPHILQHDIAGRIADDAHFLFRLTAGNTRELHVHHKRADTFAALGGICFRIDNSLMKSDKSKYGNGVKMA